MKKICFLDTCILIDIENKRDLFKKFFSYLRFSGYLLLLSKTCQIEFLNGYKKNKRKGSRVLRKFLIELCPIKVNLHEIEKINNLIDDGEADTYLQIYKMLSCPAYPVEDVIFITNDKKAINFFRKNNIPTLTSNDIFRKFS